MTLVKRARWNYPWEPANWMPHLELGARARRVLYGWLDVRTEGDLKRLNWEVVARTPGVGKKTLTEIQRVVAALDIAAPKE